VKLDVVSDEEMPWRLQADVTVNCVADLHLLISRREPRYCPYARAPRERGCPCHSCCDSAGAWAKRLLMGCVSILARDDIEIPCYAYRDQSPCLVEAEVFPRH
jgi:hypothetical protein